MGNKLRFANHSKLNQNSTAKIFFTEGKHKVGLFATRDISQNEEILFDYDGRNILWKRFPWIRDDLIANRNSKNKDINTKKFLNNKKFNKRNYDLNVFISNDDNFNDNDCDYSGSEYYRKYNSIDNGEIFSKKKRYRSLNNNNNGINRSGKYYLKGDKKIRKYKLLDEFTIDLTDLR